MTLLSLLERLQDDAVHGRFEDNTLEPRQTGVIDEPDFDEPFELDGSEYERIGAGCYHRLRAPNYDGDTED